MTVADPPRAGRHGGTVESHAGRPAFVKRATGEASAAALAREGALLRLISGSPAVRGLAPALLGEEPGVLRMEALGGRDLQGVDPCPGPDTGGEVGRALAVVHADEGLASAAPDAVVSAVFAAPRPDVALLRRMSAAGIDLLRVLQRSQALCDALVRLGAERTRSAFVHGDARFANVMVDRGAIRLVDWEFAGRGDRRDDLGAFVGSCLEAWLVTVPAVPGVPPDRLVGLAGCPLEAVTPTIDAFLGAYAGARGFDARGEHEMRLGALRFGAARLVHLAFEVASETEDLRIDHVLRLQVAANVLEDPGAAHEWLLAGVHTGRG